MTSTSDSMAMWAWVFLALQTTGMASAVVARLSEGSRLECSCQRVFLAMLGLVGASTLASLTIGPCSGLICATTFAVMALTVVCDFGLSRRAAG